MPEKRNHQERAEKFNGLNPEEKALLKKLKQDPNKLKLIAKQLSGQVR